MSRQSAVVVLLAGLLGLAPGHSIAENFATRLYGEAHLAVASVRHSDLDFYPRLSSFSGGVWLFRGIGIEVFRDFELADDNDEDFEMALERASGVALRFQSPSEKGVFAYLLLGVVDLRLEQKEENDSGARSSEVEDFRGGRISIGIGTRIKYVPGLQITGEYRNYFVDEDLPIDGISVGLRFSLR